MDVNQHLENGIRILVRFEIVGLAKAYAAGRVAGTGHFSTPREVFCYVDHLGYLAFGGASTDRAIKYLREFFPQSYHDLAGLLVAMWRHGTVHNLLPVSYRDSVEGSSKIIQVQWLSANHDRTREKGAHLLSFPIHGKSDAICLVLNTQQLAEDLLSSIDMFVNRLNGDSSMQTAANRRLADLLAPQGRSSIQGRMLREEVGAGMETVWAARGGLISETGNIIDPHPSQENIEIQPDRP